MFLKNFSLKESEWPWAGNPPDHWSVIAPHPLCLTRPWGTACSWVTLVLGCKGPLNLIKIALVMSLWNCELGNLSSKTVFLFLNWSFINYMSVCYKFQLSSNFKVHKKWWYSTCLNSSPSSIIVPYFGNNKTNTVSTL